MLPHRTFAIVAVIDLLIATAGVANASQAKSPIILKGYRITSARGWVTDSSRLKQSVTKITTEPVHHFAPILVISETNFPHEASLTDVKSLTHQHFAQLFKGFALIDERFGVLNGVKTYEATGTYSLGASKLRLRLREIFALRDGVLTTIACTVPDIDHKAYDSAFSQMIASVKWTLTPQ